MLTHGHEVILGASICPKGDQRSIWNRLTLGLIENKLSIPG